MTMPQKPDVPLGLDADAEASVVIGDIDPNDQSASFNNPQTGVFTDYRIRSSYVFDPIIFQLPIASPNGFGGQFASFVQLAATVATLKVEWSAQCDQEPPIIPNPGLKDSGYVLLNRELDMDSLELNDAGEPSFGRSGTYYYGLKNAAAATLSHPVPPYISVQSGSLVVLDSADMVNNMIDVGWTDTAAAAILAQPIIPAASDVDEDIQDWLNG